MRESRSRIFDFDEVQVKDKTYRVQGSVTADYYFQNGRMYMSNGDPGYPDEEDYEITDIDIDTVYEIDADGDENETTSYPCDEIKSEVCELIDKKGTDWWN